MTGAARRGAAAPAAHPDARPSSGPAAAIIVFDGVCALCNGWVDFLLARDRRRHYRFAAMQSPAGRGLLATHGLDADDPASFLLLDGEGAHTGTDAIVRVLRGLGGAWRVAALGRLPPRALRDRLYRLVARNLYRLFAARHLPPAGSGPARPLHHRLSRPCGPAPDLVSGPEGPHLRGIAGAAGHFP